MSPTDRNGRLLVRAVLTAAVLFALGLPAQASERAASWTAALESIRSSELAGHVDYLADKQLQGRRAGSRGGRAAARFLADQFARLGLEPAGTHGAYLQPFNSNFQNVLARIEGSDPQLRKQVVVVGAHFDHVGYGTPANSRGGVGTIHPGADDNASGVAALLEVAEALTLVTVAPRRSVLLICFDGEEIALLGSAHWTSRPTVPIDNVAAMVNLDMLGRLRNERLYVFGTRSGYGLRRLLSAQNVGDGLRLEFPWRLKAHADHYPFFQHRVPVVMFHTGLHEDYHTPRDEPKRLDYAGLERAGRLVFRVVWALADRTEPIRFRPAAASETEGQRRQLAARVPELPDRLGVSWDPAQSAHARLRITRVSTGSAAQKAGLRPGDRIVQFAGRTIGSGEELIGAVRTAPSPTTMLVQRAGAEESLELRVELPGEPVRLGVVFREDEAEPGTVIVTYVVPGTPAAAAGIRRGDRIYRAGEQEFADSAAFRGLLAGLSGRVSLVVEREGRVQTLWVELAEPQSAAVKEQQSQRPAAEDQSQTRTTLPRGLLPGVSDRHIALGA